MDRLEDILKRKKKIVKLTVAYLDDEGKVVDKKNATKTIITEYDQNGNVVNEIFGNIEKNSDREER